MNNIELSSQGKSDIVLGKLKEVEESHRLALEGAARPRAEGGATDVVIEDLQARYLLAKHEREDFEKKYASRDL